MDEIRLTCLYCGAKMNMRTYNHMFWYTCDECEAETPYAETKANALTKALLRADILRAEWDACNNEYDRCSNCGYLHPKKDPAGLDTACNYCPKCGAKMELPNKKEE